MQGRGFFSALTFFQYMDTLFSLKHFICSGYYNGHRVHSPNIFHFFKYVIFPKEKFDYSLAENTLKEYKASKEILHTLSIGAKGDGKTIKEEKVSKIAVKSSSFGKYGRLLQRMSAYLKPKKILELGTSIGIGTIYLSSGCKDSSVITVEASKETSEFAAKNFKKLGLNNIECINDNFDNALEDILTKNPDIELIFVDGNHTYAATKKYFEIIKKHAGKNTITVFDDINWSKEMSKAWKEIMQSNSKSVAIEMLRMGIIFFNKDLTQKNYCTRY